MCVHLNSSRMNGIEALAVTVSVALNKTAFMSLRVSEAKKHFVGSYRTNCHLSYERWMLKAICKGQSNTLRITRHHCHDMFSRSFWYISNTFLFVQYTLLFGWRVNRKTLHLVSLCKKNLRHSSNHSAINLCWS